MKQLMTGNEAIARGAYEAGVKYASAYPGTPSTEILENIALYKNDIVAEWAPNEKVALESAAGGAFAGARTVASMKHVGLNVAADPLFTVAYTGINGGFVVITADEPGMHSSQNEQDNRNYAKSAKVPLLEPATSQEAKDMMKMAYEISEKYNTLVMMRLTTRLCHSKGLVECEERNEVGIKPYTKEVKRVTVPANARLLRIDVEEREKKLYKFSNETELNYMEINEGAKVGVISSGMCFNFAKEVFGKDASYLKLGFTNPMPDEKIKELILIGEESGYDYVIEEDGLCHIDVENSSKIAKLQKKNKKNICKFDKKTLIKAGVPDFMEEHKCGKNLQRVLGEMFIIDKEILKDEMDSFTISIKNEMPMEKAIDLFLDAYEIDTEEEKNILAYELEHLAKSIKRWSLNGYSENEITKQEQRVVNEVKIGRNDPCLCGSKKKYKKCCGR